MLKLIKNNYGDTIVEVLISLAILSLAFAISYATANRALINTQNSQEHATALEYLDSQLEALHYYVDQAQQTPPSNSFYLQPDLINHTVQEVPGAGSEPGNGFSYSISLIRDASNSYTYHATITWPGLGSLGQQSEELSYRVY